MLNIEHYAEELRPFGTCFAITKDGKIKDCQEIECEACVFNYAPEDNCDKVRLEWLLKEYVEPVLTDKEKAYLKSIIEFVRNDITNVKKTAFTADGINELTCITISGKNPCYGIELIKFITTKDMSFEGMELNKKYDLMELGINV